MNLFTKMEAWMDEYYTAVRGEGDFPEWDMPTNDPMVALKAIKNWAEPVKALMLVEEFRGYNQAELDDYLAMLLNKY